MHLTTGRKWMAGCAAIAALGIAAPMQASASGASVACRNAQHRLARDQARHAPKKIIQRDQKLVRHYCKK